MKVAELKELIAKAEYDIFQIVEKLESYDVNVNEIELHATRNINDRLYKTHYVTLDIKI